MIQNISSFLPAFFDIKKTLTQKRETASLSHESSATLKNTSRIVLGLLGTAASTYCLYQLCPSSPASPPIQAIEPESSSSLGFFTLCGLAAALFGKKPLGSRAVPSLRTSSSQDLVRLPRHETVPVAQLPLQPAAGPLFRNARRQTSGASQTLVRQTSPLVAEWMQQLQSIPDGQVRVDLPRDTEVRSIIAERNDLLAFLRSTQERQLLELTIPCTFRMRNGTAFQGRFDPMSYLRGQRNLRLPEPTGSSNQFLDDAQHPEPRTPLPRISHTLSNDELCMFEEEEAMCKGLEEIPSSRLDWGVSFISKISQAAGSVWDGLTGWTSFLHQAITHEIHPAHNQKYLLALEAQKTGLQRFLAANFPYNSSPLDFLANLENGFLGIEAESPYQDFRNGRGSPLFQNLIGSLDALLRPEKYENVRTRNAAYLFFLRNALETAEYRNNDFPLLSDMIRRLCRDKFLGNCMTGYEDAFLQMATQSTPEHLDASSIANAIEEGNRRLHHCDESLRKAPQDLLVQKFRNEVGIFCDPLATSNVPEIRSIHKVSADGAEYPIMYMRHGTITLEPGVSTFLNRAVLGSNTVTIIPEYRGFLDAMQQDGQKALYVNHQNMSEPGPEYNRGEAIESLQTDYPGSFYFLSLPFDGPLLKTIGQGSFANFKERLLRALIYNQAGFRLPAGFEASEEFAEIADQVHKLYFEGAEDLTEKERKAYLMIFYSYVKEVIKARCSITAMVSACKDNKDRGNASSSVDEALFNLRLGRENDPKALYDLYVRTLAPFIIKYEHIIPDRLEMLLNVLEQISKLSRAQKAGIQRYAPVPGFSIVDQNVPRTSYQDAVALSDQRFDSPAQLIAATSNGRMHIDAPDARSKIEFGFFERSSDPATWRPGFRDRKGAWDDRRLLHQLERDLPCISVTVNGHQADSLEKLLEILETSREKLSEEILPFLCCLQQGVAAVSIDAIQDLLKNQGQFTDCVVTQGIPDKAEPHITRINASFAENRIEIEQDLRIINGDEMIPITVNIIMEDHDKTRITWTLPGEMH